MIISFLVGMIVGAVIMFLAIRKGYIVIKNKSKKPKLPRDMEIGA